MKNTGQKGFTLIELMVTIAIAAILVTAGVPAFIQFVQNNRRAAELNGLVRALNMARSTAVRQRTTVRVCASSNQTDCITDWSKGWIVFADKDDDKTADTGELIHVFPPLDGGNNLFPHVSTMMGYVSTGLSTASGYFTLCDPRGPAQARAVIVSAAGAIRTSDKNDVGNALACQ
ncbi:MAG TPA: GspH/FimT family pseudopilin [Gammaproteobacteria bacterium]|nr:GspH/FimT family pseudopilin [Gammaproteobacteria bacterium]